MFNEFHDFREIESSKNRCRFIIAIASGYEIQNHSQSINLRKAETRNWKANFEFTKKE